MSQLLATLKLRPSSNAVEAQAVGGVASRAGVGGNPTWILGQHPRSCAITCTTRRSYYEPEVRRTLVSSLGGLDLSLGMVSHDLADGHSFGAQRVQPFPPHANLRALA
jgi:hypothetical protein